MNIRISPAQCLISFEPDEDTFHREGMKFGIIIPDRSRHKCRVAFCHLHEIAGTFDEDLTGKRLVVDRWASRIFTMHHNGKEHEFAVISQWHVLGVVEETKQ